MKRVFIIPGYYGWPNGAWRAWLMNKLNEKEIYACSLPMPLKDPPVCQEWVDRITEYINTNHNPDDQVYLVGHSLGSTAILRYLESGKSINVKGVVLVSGVIKPIDVNHQIDDFLNRDFNFDDIKLKSSKFVIIHGDNDSRVPFEQAKELSSKLNCKLVPVKNGGHLTGSEGFHELPELLEELINIIND